MANPPSLNSPTSPTSPSSSNTLLNSFNKWRAQTEELVSTHVTKITHSLADGVDKVLKSMPDSTERDRALRRLISSYAPSPVPGAEWSLINSADFDFDGFSGQHLTEYTALNQLQHVPNSAFQTPSLLVIRDMSLASKLAYEDPVLIKYVCNTWNMETSDALNFSFKDIRAFIMYDAYNIVLSFRGTEIINPKDWSTDVQLKFTPMIPQATDGASLPDEASAKSNIMAHYGFYNALGLTSTYEGVGPFSVLCSTLNQLHQANPQKKIWVTGHSLGGALASVFVAQLLLDNDELIRYLGGVYTFGQPRSGNEAYARLFDDLINNGLLYRIVNKTDLVCKLPMQVTKYLHHGGKVKLSNWRLIMPCKGQVVELLPTKTQKALPPNSNLKKIVFTLLPTTLGDHYPCEYVRNMQLFV